MVIENLPVWSFSPDWSGEVTETLEWKTDILQSGSGAEQRRALREHPRRFLEYDLLVGERERAYLDNYLSAAGGSDCYLPLWHDTYHLPAAIPAGADFLPLASAQAGWFSAPGCAMIGGASAMEFELVEISDIGSGGLSIVGSTLRSWPAGTSVYPAVKARFADDSQPDLSRQTSGLVDGSVKFLVAEPGTSLAAPTIGIMADSYGGVPVLCAEPDESEDLTFNYTRIFDELDNSVSAPLRADRTGRPFTVQQFRWVLDGRAEHRAFEALLQSLRGRARPFLVPTFMDDFRLVASVASGATSITVENVGFTAFGGPRPERRHIRILLTTGQRLYREIVSSAMDGENEVLNLSEAFPAAIPIRNVLRISFLTLMRLDHDAVEIHHLADVDGVSAVSLNIRSAPDLRVGVPAA